MLTKNRVCRVRHVHRTDVFGNVWIEVDDGADADLIRRDPPRRKDAHPYNFDPFTIWGEPYPNDECNGTAWTDRLSEANYNKYEKFAKVYYLNQRPFDQHRCQGHLIEGFLRDWFDDPELQLLRVIEYCNSSTGYPTWRLDYISTKGSK